MRQTVPRLRSVRMKDGGAEVRVLHRNVPPTDVRTATDSLASYVRANRVERVAWVVAGIDVDGVPFTKVQISPGPHQNALIAGTQDLMYQLMKARWEDR